MGVGCGSASGEGSRGLTARGREGGGLAGAWIRRGRRKEGSSPPPAPSPPRCSALAPPPGLSSRSPLPLRLGAAGLATSRCDIAATSRAGRRGCSASRRGGAGLERHQRCASPEQRSSWSSRLAGHCATPPPGAANAEGAAAGGRHGEAEGEGGRMEREMTCGTRTKGTLVLLPFPLSYPVKKYNF